MVAFDRLADGDFRRLAAFIHETAGLRVLDTKRLMLESRLRRRAWALSMPGLAEYGRYLFANGGMGDEAVHIINAATTNKTDFFREPEHFRLMEELLPELLAERGGGSQAPLKIWSSACSIGAEPYTIAMVMGEFSRLRHGCRFEITATDICTDALDAAIAGIYPRDMLAQVPADLRRRYVMTARDPTRLDARIVPELRRFVRFGRLNLMEPTYPMQRDLDVIFCRNLLIYFERPVQQTVLERLCRHLRHGGILFLGHCETINGMDLPLRALEPTVFRRE
jgi:chemotaxis protein methyltransferase CheR